MSNDINTLRQHLFDTLAALKDKDRPMDIERAKAVSEVAQVIINTAKVEVEFLKANPGHKDSGFLNAPQQLPPGITAITRHTLKG